MHILILCLDLHLSSAEDIICDNPEQLHTGFFQSVEVGFDNLSMTLKQKKKGVADSDLHYKI